MTRRRSLHGLALVLLVASSAAQAPPAAEGPALDLAPVRALLRLRRDDARTAEDVVAALVRLGPAEIDALYRIAAGDGLELLFPPEEPYELERFVCTPEEACELALAALERQPVPLVVTFLARELEPPPAERGRATDAPAAPAGTEGESVPWAPTVETRQAVLRVLGALGSADGLELVWRISASFGDLSLSYPSVRNGVRGALTDILRADPRAWRLVGERRERLEPFERGLVLEALQETERAEGAALALALLGQTSQPEDMVRLVGVLARLEELHPTELAGTTVRELAHCWLRLPASERRTAAACLARTADPEAVGTLLELLEENDGRARRIALAGLSELCGLRVGEDSATWRAWLERERAWWNEHAEELCLRVGEDDPAAASDALRELARHRLFRRDLAQRVAAGLTDQPTATALQSCRLLSTLDSRAALAGLVRVLDSEPSAVVEAALRSLRELTGHDLGEDARAWRELAGG